MKHAQIHAKLLVVAAIWGLGWPAGRVVAADVTPIVAAWIRYVIVAGLFMFYLQRTEGWSYPSPTQWKNIAFIAFFSTFLYQSMFMYGMKFTDVGDYGRLAREIYLGSNEAKRPPCAFFL